MPWPRRTAPGRPAGAVRSPADRQRRVDRAVAAATWPLTVLLTLTRGWVEEHEGSWVRSQAPSLAFRHLPGPAGEGPGALTTLLGHWPLALTVLFCVPGLTAWAALDRRNRPEWLLALAVLWLLLFGNIAPVAIALYSYAAWFTDRRRLAAWSAAAAAAFAAGLGNPAAVGWSTPAVYLVALLTPVSLGLWAGTRRRLVATLRERAEHLEREQRLLAERATAAERTRIAREMHDVVAHRVSLMVLQAGGLELSTGDPAAAACAERIRLTGREALGELRGVLGALHDAADTGAPTAPPPVLADLDHLIQEWRTAGMTVHYAATGTPRPLAAAVERAAYRVAQEALTNADKHAPGHPLRLTLHHGPRQLTVTAVNPAPPAGTGARTGGYGLTGLRERITLLGGAFTAGPHPPGMWRLHAALPAGEPPGQEPHR
ncbi:sensor histidine kinase [Streptomyces sp. YIM 98790]|uniref:sensor histidine kinase n=1 Tax=Streptomyces sp. YIM 98790 TaxID=2689077 RepID=UPI00140AD911|nr:histidine kinase [Streptomyces sp. YIM 98790]